MAQDGRFRLRHHFWLDLNNPDDAALAELIDDLKISKRYTHTLRRGIRLDADLQNGRLDVLFALYPWVKELFILGQGRGSDFFAVPSRPTFDDDDDMPAIVIEQVSSDDAADNLLNSLDSLDF
jgi:hypothetical protein